VFLTKSLLLTPMRPRFDVFIYLKVLVYRLEVWMNLSGPFERSRELTRFPIPLQVDKDGRKDAVDGAHRCSTYLLNPIPRPNRWMDGYGWIWFCTFPPDFTFLEFLLYSLHHTRCRTRTAKPNPPGPPRHPHPHLL
jgi:hypothetical protein